MQSTLFRFSWKVVILNRHLLYKQPLSKLCDELGLQPAVFYRWQKEFFENLPAAFQPKAGPYAGASGTVFEVEREAV